MSRSGKFFFSRNWLENSNHEQKLFVGALERYLTEHQELRHYDVIGLLPRRNLIWLYAGPGHGYGSKSLVDQLARETVDLFVNVGRAVFFEPDLTGYLATGFVNIGHEVYARSRVISVHALSERHLVKKVTELGRDRFEVSMEDLAQVAQVSRIYYVFSKNRARMISPVSGRTTEGKISLASQALKTVEFQSILVMSDAEEIIILSVPPFRLTTERPTFQLFAYDRYY